YPWPHASAQPAHVTELVPLVIRLLFGTFRPASHFSESSANGGTREASGLRDRGDAPPPDGHRFAGSPATPHFFVQHRAQRLVFVPYGGYDFCIGHNGSWLSVSKGRSFQGESDASSQRLYCPLPRMPCLLVQSTRHSSLG